MCIRISNVLLRVSIAAGVCAVILLLLAFSCLLVSPILQRFLELNVLPDMLSVVDIVVQGTVVGFGVFSISLLVVALLSSVEQIAEGFERIGRSRRNKHNGSFD